MKLPVIFILLITIAMCNMGKSEDEFKTALEGDNVQLNFPYPCNSTKVSLQDGHRAPFYIFTDSESISLPPVQVDRFIFKIGNKSSHCSLILGIFPVKRTDAGTYIFFAYMFDEDGYELENSFQRIRLEVDFPPGKASCTLTDEHSVENVGNWVTLQCTAPVGSSPSQIDCYQNGERMPPLTAPVETNGHLKQTVRVKKTQPVFCCSSTWEHSKDRCSCTDFQWDLANNQNLSTIVDPCGSTTPISSEIESSQIASSPSIVTTAQETTVGINNPNDSLPWKYVVLGLGSVLIVSGFVSFVIVKFHSRNSKKKLSSYTLKFTPTKQHAFAPYERIPNKWKHSQTI